MLFKESIATVLQNIINKIYPDFQFEVRIENTKISGLGDFSTNIAMVSAGKLKKKPLDTAQEISEELKKDSVFSDINISNPGFINFRVSSSFLRESLQNLYSNFNSSTKINIGENKRYNVEFVSANPTGPLNVVNARAASVGAAVSNLLSRIGYSVSREYYINDAGTQMEIFGNSVRLRYLELHGIKIDFPDNHYQGEYVIEIVNYIKENFGDIYLHIPEAEQLKIFKIKARELVLQWQKEALEEFGIKFDVWFSEDSELHKSGKIDKIFDTIKNKNLSYESEGAVWLKTKIKGDEKDRALYRGSGSPTYFLGDIAYHKDKFDRGFEYLLDFWGPDHHGHIKRTEIALELLDMKVSNFKVLIIQQINFVNHGEHLKMSKRKGKLVTLQELISEIDKDVCKFFFLMRSNDSHLDFDIGLAKTESSENPVYYVQYAHARACSILEKCKSEYYDIFKNVVIDRCCKFSEIASEPEEIELIKTLLSYLDEIKNSAVSLQPHKLTNYLRKLSSDFHSFYHKHKVMNCENDILKKERIGLIDCCRSVISDALTLLNIRAPEKM